MSQMTARRVEKPSEPEVFNFAPQSENEKGKILGFSGKLSAGKDSCSRFLYSIALMHTLGDMHNGKFYPLTYNAYVNPENGKLMVEDREGLKEFNEDSRSPEVVNFLQSRVWPFIRKFSTADPLKNFLHKMFNVPVESLWGTQEEKLVPIGHILWENMPGYTGPKSGPMNGRELMEFYGTDVIRHTYEDAHANAMITDILEYNSQHSLVNDIRFKNEVTKLQEAGGKVIRLTRCSPEAKKNKHRSNVELDNFDGFDAVIQNDKMTMDDTFRELMRILTSWGWFKVVN